MLKGYQEMPTEELLSIEEEVLSTPVETIASRAGVRFNCSECGEKIINEHKVVCDDRVLCRPCAGPTYYKPASASDLFHQIFCSQMC